MLPLITLQPSDLANFETGLNAPELLPPEAAEPSAAFADLLRLGVETGDRQLPVVGIRLPQAGNELPLPALPEGEAAEAEISATPLVPASLQAEVGRPVAALPTTGAGRLGDALGLTPSVTSDTAAPATRQTDLAARMAVFQGQFDGEQPALNGSLRQDIKATQAGTILPVPQPRPAVSLAAEAPAAPAASSGPAINAVASELQEEILPTLRRPAPAATPAVAIGSETSNVTPGAERTMPLERLSREELLVDRRPVQQTPNTVQPAAQTLNIAINVESSAPAPTTQGATVQLTQAQAPAQATTTTPTLQTGQTINVPVRDAAWGEAIGERVALMASNRLQSAEIRLTPAELGPLRVQVAVDDGLANVTFHAQHAVTREAIEQALPRLRELLAENGLTLNQANVGQDAEQSLLQGIRDRDGQPADKPSVTEDQGADQTAQDLATAPRANPRPDSLVDTFV